VKVILFANKLQVEYRWECTEIVRPQPGGSPATLPCVVSQAAPPNFGAFQRSAVATLPLPAVESTGAQASDTLRFTVRARAANLPSPQEVQDVLVCGVGWALEGVMLVGWLMVTWIRN
jgi:hypothetical protein